MSMTLGARLRERRRSAGLSQTQLAGSELSPSYISLLESDKRQATPQILGLLADRLGCTVTDLTGEPPDADPGGSWLTLRYAELDFHAGRPQDTQIRVRALLAQPRLDDRVRDAAFLLLGQAHERLADYDGCVAVLTPLYERARAGQAAVSVATLGITLCGALLDGGDFHRALMVGEQALETAEAQGLAGSDEYLRLKATVMGVYYELGDLTHANVWAQRVIKEFEAGTSRAGQAGIYWNASLIAQAKGDKENAVRFADRARAFLSEQENSRDLARLRATAARVLMQSAPSRIDEAIGILDRGYEELVALGSDQDLAYWEEIRSSAEILRGDGVAAETFARRALGRLDDPASIEHARARVALGDALAAQDRRGDAVVASVAILDAFHGLPVGRDAAVLARELGDRLSMYGDVASAQVAYRLALETMGVHGMRPQPWSADPTGSRVRTEVAETSGVPAPVPVVLRPRHQD